MKLQEMLELIKQHHPQMGNKEIVNEINRAMDDFSQKTRIVKSSYSFDLVQDQRYYNLDDNILEVMQVAFDSGDSKGKRIPRLVGTPEERDIG